MTKETKTEFYLRLTYSEYKELERQLQNWQEIETSHVSVDGFYHKALRLEIGSTLFEIQGPTVKSPLVYDGGIIDSLPNIPTEPEDARGPNPNFSDADPVHEIKCIFLDCNCYQGYICAECNDARAKASGY